MIVGRAPASKKPYDAGRPNVENGGLVRGPSGIEDRLNLSEAGLCCAPGDFHIDPHRAVERAVITHGHADHARPGHRNVLATPETLATMRQRYGAEADNNHQARGFGQAIDINGVDLRLAPAGHVLGSAQVVLEWNGQLAVISGDYKRAADPTCEPHEAVPYDLLITEATFALPVFRHEPAAREIARLLTSLATFPERTHLIGAYSLGKSQRLIRCLRDAGFDETIWLYGSVIGLCALYEELGVELGPLQPAAETPARAMKGAIVISRAAAVGQRPLGAQACRSCGGFCVRLDARARSCPTIGCRAAAGDFRSCRLGRSDKHHHRGRGRGGLGDPWTRGRVGPSARFACLKLIIGGLRADISARLAKQAVANFAAVDVQRVEEIWHGLEPPYLSLFA